MAALQPSPAAPPSPAALLRPCIERIQAAAGGRKYAKLRDDAAALLGKLDTLLVLQGAHPPRAAAQQQQQPPAEPAEQPPAPPAAEPGAAEPGSPQRAASATEEVEVSLQEGEDGQVAFKLSLSPSKVAGAAEADAEEAGVAVAEHHEVDPGHMPVSPSRGPAARHGTSRRPEPRPGALHDGAARGGLGCCRRCRCTVLCTLLPGAVVPCRQRPAAHPLPLRCRAAVPPARRRGHTQAAADGGCAGLHPEDGVLQAAAGPGAPHQPQARGRGRVGRARGSLRQRLLHAGGFSPEA